MSEDRVDVTDKVTIESTSRSGWTISSVSGRTRIFVPFTKGYEEEGRLFINRSIAVAMGVA